jgi:hypothetical protein
MQSYDFSTAQGQQEFQRWIVELIRKEINSYVQQVLFQRNTTYIDNNLTTTPLTDAERLTRLETAVFRR